MKMFCRALVSVVPAFVLLVTTQFEAGAAGTPQPPATQSWFTDDHTAKDHIWLRVGMLEAKLAAPSDLRQLSFEDRVAYQRAIEEVLWRHRIWPKERSDPKPSLDAVISQAAIEKKVQDYLRQSELLEEERQKPIMPEQLQAEMERMASYTKQPEVLRELFAALGNDPFVIAECLARPVLMGRLQFAMIEPRKASLDSSSAKAAQEEMPKVMAAANANYMLPAISDQPSDCIDDSWTDTSTNNAPIGRSFHTAVWTGAEMIVWGGSNIPNYSNTGGRYNPSTDSWTATSTTNAPSSRESHSAVWTGSEMIVWGGLDENSVSLNTGGRYNPSSDTWNATSTTDAPEGRAGHTAVWTGSEMIIWGGSPSVNAYSNTGGKYDPDTDSWTATSTTNAPRRRTDHTAVWTGSEMIVWGGAGSGILRTGGRYNPRADTWMALATYHAPVRRVGHTAVWTGSEMIVWGGTPDAFDVTIRSGGIYNPGSNSWRKTSTHHAPASRFGHTAVWTGSEMIVWGGNSLSYPHGYHTFNTGGRYNPQTDSWTATRTTNAPTARSLHTAVWTESEMIVWGGENDRSVALNTGGRYCAQAGSPTVTLDAKKPTMEETNAAGWHGAGRNTELRQPPQALASAAPVEL